MDGAQGGNVYQVSYNAGGRGYTVNGGANGQTQGVNVIGGAGAAANGAAANGAAGNGAAGNGLTIQGGSGLNAGNGSGVFVNGNKVADYNG